MDRYDFRSDTVTWPTAAMRNAMAEAAIGDDVYGEDPTVNELEKLAAEKLGFEAGLFVSSGTQGNLCAILAHANRGDEAIVGDGNHTYRYEAGGMAVLGGIMPKLLPMGDDGMLNLDEVRASVREDNTHYPTSRLILTENTVGSRYGAAVGLDYFAEIRKIADEHGLAVHLDGARVFNAAEKLGVDIKEVTRDVDSVSFCLSKGLCAPVGSVLVGSEQVIHKARRMRKILGGGMRQAGFMAAAGIVALNEMTDRLREDHGRAMVLAKGLAEIDGIEINLDNVHTNMVFFKLSDELGLTTAQVAESMQETHNVWLSGGYGTEFRAVTHYWIDDAGIEAFLGGMRQAIE